MKPQISDFISRHADDDPSNLILTYSGSMGRDDLDIAVTQIICRRKTKSKIPFFLAKTGFFFPDKDISEQATNQWVAAYHASVVGTGYMIADLTAGLGIDAFTLAMAGNSVEAFEIDACRADTLAKNSLALNLQVNVTSANSIEFLQNNPGFISDWIFIDPARRENNKSRHFLLQDSLPDVTECQQLLISHAPKVMIKASPLLDITQTLKDIDNVAAIHIVCFRGECKEMLVEAHREPDSSVARIIVADISDDSDSEFPSFAVISKFETTVAELGPGEPRFTGRDDIQPGMWLYELNAGMRKLDGCAEICRRFSGIMALTKNSGLFISRLFYEGFPGRAERIEEVYTGSLPKDINGQRFRVISADHPASVESIRKKYRFKEGSGNSIYFTRMAGNNKVVIVTRR